MMIKAIASLTAALALATAARADDDRALEFPPAAEPLHVSLPPAAGSAFRLVELGEAGATIPVSVVGQRDAAGLPVAGQNRLVATIPPADAPRRFRLEAIAAGPESPFRIADVDARSVGVWQGDKPILVYNHGVITHEGAPEELARSSYVHPLYGVDGEVLSDDFPPDHLHHRGLFWAWPHVVIDGEEYDLWIVKGVRQKFERWLAREAGPALATLGVENGWYVGDRRVMVERVWFDIHPAGRDARSIDVALTFIPEADPVTLDGAEGKSYGGLNLRYAPGADVKITTPLGDGPDDLLMTPLPWADLSARFANDQVSGAAIIVDPRHPDFPPTWLTRHYGVLCVGWPGVTPKTLEPKRPTTLRYRLWTHRGPADAPRLARVAVQAFELGGGFQWPSAEPPRLLVYSRNYTPDGKGYVHENIPHCVEALKAIGAELGCAVDAADDPAVFTPENLARYQAVIFANSNNEAFATDDQRRAFEVFLKNGGGLVGIHSATGSERAWPVFWSAMGGKFRRHPRLQKFTVRVADAGHPAARGLPPSFEWEDECYFHEFLNPDIHPILVTDPTRLDDPQFPKDPGSLVGRALPLVWSMETGGRRTFYSALGHKAEHYEDPRLRELLKNGVQWATEKAKP